MARPALWWLVLAAGWVAGRVAKVARLAWWWLDRRASRVRCWATRRHREGSPAWEAVSTAQAPGFRPRAVYACRFCGVVAIRSGEHRRVREEARRLVRGAKAP